MPPRREVDVTFRLRVRLEGDTARWTAEVKKRDPAIRVMAVWAPMLNGLRLLADWALYYPRDRGLRLADPVQNLGDRGQMFRIAHPWSAAMGRAVILRPLGEQARE